MSDNIKDTRDSDFNTHEQSRFDSRRDNRQHKHDKVSANYEREKAFDRMRYKGDSGDGSFSNNKNNKKSRLPEPPNQSLFKAREHTPQAKAKAVRGLEHVAKDNTKLDSASGNNKHYTPKVREGYNTMYKEKDASHKTHNEQIKKPQNNKSHNLHTNANTQLTQKQEEKKQNLSADKGIARSKSPNPALEDIRVDILYARICMATVKECKVTEVDSVGISKELMNLAGLYNGMRVEIINNTNGRRFSTYCIESTNGSSICINGILARELQKGDIITILAFANTTLKHAKGMQTRTIPLDSHNKALENQSPSS